jgi:hypothetical protein
MAEDASITLDRLRDLRRVTQAMSEDLEKELRGYLETLAPIVRPKRLLGDLIAGESTETYPDSEKAFQELQELFRRVSERPFRLRPTLPKPIPSIRVRLEIYPWEEVWEPAGGGRGLAIVSPFAWTLTFPGACSLRDLRRMLAGDEARDENKIHQLVLNACILHLLIERTPGLASILAGLRYSVETRRAADLGELPIPVVRSEVGSVRPPAQVMVDAAAFAGQDLFEEVIDPNALETLQDPLRMRLAKHLGGMR